MWMDGQEMRITKVIKKNEWTEITEVITYQKVRWTFSVFELFGIVSNGLSYIFLAFSM